MNICDKELKLLQLVLNDFMSKPYSELSKKYGNITLRDISLLADRLDSYLCLDEESCEANLAGL